MQQLIFHLSFSCTDFYRLMFSFSWLAVDLASLCRHLISPSFLFFYFPITMHISIDSHIPTHPTSLLTHKIFHRRKRKGKEKRHTKPPVISSRKARDNLKFIHSDSTSCYNFYFERKFASHSIKPWKVWMGMRGYLWSLPLTGCPPTNKLGAKEDEKKQVQHMGKAGRRTNTRALSFFYSFSLLMP